MQCLPRAPHLPLRAPLWRRRVPFVGEVAQTGDDEIELQMRSKAPPSERRVSPTYDRVY